MAQCQLIFPISFRRTFGAAENREQIRRTLITVHILLQEEHGFRRQRHRQRTTRFAATVSNDIPPKIALPQVSQIDKRQSPKQEHENKQFLRTPHAGRYGGRLQQTGKHLLHVFHIQRPPAVRPRTCIYGTEQMRHVRRTMKIDGPIVNGTHRAKVRRHRVPTTPSGTKATLKMFQPLRSYFPKLHAFRFLKNKNRIQTTSIHMSSP